MSTVSQIWRRVNATLFIVLDQHLRCVLALWIPWYLGVWILVIFYNFSHFLFAYSYGFPPGYAWARGWIPLSTLFISHTILTCLKLRSQVPFFIEISSINFLCPALLKTIPSSILVDGKIGLVRRLILCLFDVNWRATWLPSIMRKNRSLFFRGLVPLVFLEPSSRDFLW